MTDEERLFYRIGKIVVFAVVGVVVLSALIPQAIAAAYWYWPLFAVVLPGAALALWISTRSWRHANRVAVAMVIGFEVLAVAAVFAWWVFGP
jgi:hypothetical protein